ncbi:MAG: hypothetical protein EOS21_00160 [Mesorhizobium sp.]|nr:MAG: hypothetical protein EOS21_00160 [Mesorhizobium sp.]
MVQVVYECGGSRPDLPLGSADPGAQLARSIGISFQQLQKYKNAKNSRDADGTELKVRRTYTIAADSPYSHSIVLKHQNALIHRGKSFR